MYKKRTGALLDGYNKVRQNMQRQGDRKVVKFDRGVSQRLFSDSDGVLMLWLQYECRVRC